MTRPGLIEIKIDKLTRSIESTVSGESVKTDVLPLSPADLRTIRNIDWLFDWKREAQHQDKTVYKLVIQESQAVIQGLISLQDKGDHIYMALIESSPLNRGTDKRYLGVPGNLVAFACKYSFDKGYEGYISFESKTKLVSHYEMSLGARVLFGNVMVIDTAAAQKLVNQYFRKNS